MTCCQHLTKSGWRCAVSFSLMLAMLADEIFITLLTNKKSGNDDEAHAVYNIKFTYL
jgi:hypothetical protein